VTTATAVSGPATGRVTRWRDGLRSYQIEAVEAALTGLPTHKRGTIVMACGSGKTIVGIRAADALAPTAADSVLVLAPSLALLDQLFRRWAEHSRVQFVPLAVCSDDEIGTGTTSGDDTGIDGATLSIPATTDTKTVADFLVRDTDGPKVVFATYHSSPVIAQATTTTGHVWTLAVCDEAHRTAGKAGSVFTTVLSNAKVPCQMRLFLTASPRVHTAATTSDGRELISMDNEAIYGPRLFTYTFGRGITEGWLSDYRVLVLVVDSAEVFRCIHRGAGLDFNGRPVNAARAAAILGLLRASEEHDLSRVIAFHNTITASRHFANDLAYLSTTVSDTEKPVASFHLDGLASPAARRSALAALAGPAERTRVVVNNVRVLGEGVDIPALDGIMFAEPKSSQIDVIQAVGRAIRRNPYRSTPSIVIVPVYLAQGESPSAVLSGSTFKHVWQVLNALRDHDAALDAQLSAIRRNAYDPDRPAYEPNVLPEKIIITGLSTTAEAFSSAIATMLLDHTTTTWSYGYDRFVDYYRQHRTGAVPSRYVDPATQFPLGSWVQSQRQAYRWGRLTAEQISQLETKGFEWGRRTAQWRNNITLIHTLAAGTGSWMTAPDLCLLAPSLAPWFRSVQQRRDKGSLTDSERDELSDLCAWGTDPLRGLFADSSHVDAVLRIATKRKRLPRSANMTISGRPVTTAQLLDLLNLAARCGVLTEGHRAQFAKVGISLPPVEPDIDPTQPGWEPAALRRLAATTTNANAILVAKQVAQPAAHRPGIENTVTLSSLVSGPRGYWQRVFMDDAPVSRHGFDDVLPRTSSLIQDAETRAGRADEFIVRADKRVWRRATVTEVWVPAGRISDHIDALVCVVVPTPGAGAEEPQGALSVVVDDGVGEDLPKGLIHATCSAVHAELLPPDDNTFASHLLKSYGIKRIHLFDSPDEADEFIARARRRKQRPAYITDEIGDNINTVMRQVRNKIFRESLALTIPKVADAYHAGRLEGWL
jgi:superfamily II DNA or RNA helicase